MATAVHTVEEYLAFLSANTPPDLDHWYRGQQSNGWDLSASVFRTAARRTNEVVMLKRFVQEARRHLDETPTDRWDWVFLAQHHHVPTRLLDWSEMPLVGLYFASLDHLDIEGDPKSARDGRVWILRPTSLNTKQGFSYTGRDIPLFGVDKDLDDYHPYDGTANVRPPIAALAGRTFSRIAAQWGTFTVCNAPSPLDHLPDCTDYLISVDVPVAAKSSIREQLSRLGIDDRTIYLDLFRLGQHLGLEYG
jgi:hypothetical protein